MNCTICQPLLSAYIDESMSLSDRAVIESHLKRCAVCHALAEDLTAIRSAAGSLEPLIPPARAWHRVAAAAAAQSREGWFQGWLAWRSLTAVAMTAVIAAGLWRVGTLLDPATAPRSASSLADVAPEPGPVGAEADFILAIAQLEEVTGAERGVLDRETAGALNAGLTVIDDAIIESRAALEAEPQNELAQESHFAALRRKVALLQEMIVLINEMRQGDQDGAARSLSEIN